jgi:hypothetical protein
MGFLAATLAVGALGAGCGDDKKRESTQAGATPAEAIQEIAKVRSGLDQALASYRAGDEKAADTQAGDAYLKHFEEVEGPLEAKNHDLKEALEHDIRDELRAKIKAGAPKAEVAKLVDAINADLDDAETALR